MGVRRPRQHRPPDDVDLTRVRPAPRAARRAADGDRFLRDRRDARSGPRPTDRSRCRRRRRLSPVRRRRARRRRRRRILLVVRPSLRPAPDAAAGVVRSIDSEGEDVRTEEGPAMGACTHPGLRHEHNEDAVALAWGTTPLGERFRIVVVCDGISSSSCPERASQLAARIVRDTLAHFCRSGDVAFEGAARRRRRGDPLRAHRRVHRRRSSRGRRSAGDDVRRRARRRRARSRSAG